MCVTSNQARFEMHVVTAFAEEILKENPMKMECTRSYTNRNDTEAQYFAIPSYEY